MVNYYTTRNSFTEAELATLKSYNLYENAQNAFNYSWRYLSISGPLCEAQNDKYQYVAFNMGYLNEFHNEYVRISKEHFLLFCTWIEAFGYAVANKMVGAELNPDARN